MENSNIALLCILSYDFTYKSLKSVQVTTPHVVEYMDYGFVC